MTASANAAPLPLAPVARSEAAFSGSLSGAPEERGDREPAPMSETDQAFLGSLPQGPAQLAEWTAALERNSLPLLEEMARRHGPLRGEKELILLANRCVDRGDDSALSFLLSWEGARETIRQSDVSFQGPGLGHPLSHAISALDPDIDCIRVLCSLGVDIPLQSPGRLSPLMNAAQSSLEVLSLVLAHDADPARLVQVSNVDDTQRSPFSVLDAVSCWLFKENDEQTLEKIKLLSTRVSLAGWSGGLASQVRANCWKTVEWMLEQRVGWHGAQDANAALFEMAWRGAPMLFLRQLAPFCQLRAKSEPKSRMDGRPVLLALLDWARKSMDDGPGAQPASSPEWNSLWERVDFVASLDRKQDGVSGFWKLCGRDPLKLPQTGAALEAEEIRRTLLAANHRAAGEQAAAARKAGASEPAEPHEPAPAAKIARRL